MADSLFTDVANWAKKSPLIILVCAAAAYMLVSGAHFWLEDANSNYQWVRTIEGTLGIRVGSWESTYRYMSVFPQLAQTIFLYTWASDRRKNRWTMWAALAMFFVDYIPDVWWRGNGQISLRTSNGFLAMIATNLVTLGYYTIGSEIALSFGFGTFFATLAPAIAKARQLGRDLVQALNGKEQQQQSKQQRRENQQQPLRDPNWREHAGNRTGITQHTQNVRANHPAGRAGSGFSQDGRVRQQTHPGGNQR